MNTKVLAFKSALISRRYTISLVALNPMSESFSRITAFLVLRMAKPMFSSSSGNFITANLRLFSLSQIGEYILTRATFFLIYRQHCVSPYLPLFKRELHNRKLRPIFEMLDRAHFTDNHILRRQKRIFFSDGSEKFIFCSPYTTQPGVERGDLTAAQL